MFAATDISRPIWIVWVFSCCALAVSWLAVESIRHWQTEKEANQTAKNQIKNPLLANNLTY